MQYTDRLFRPPAEARSLIFQVAYGCPHNTCRFCAMYKGVLYKLRPQVEVFAEFARAAQRYPQTRRVFLADGDVMALSFERLRSMLEELNRLFPRLARVNLYANGRSILSKSDLELSALRRLKLSTLYLGLESGDEELLLKVDKGESAAGMCLAVQRAQRAGFKCSVMILLGIGGCEGSACHADATAALLNRMQPRLLSALRFIDVPGTDMYPGYQTLSEFGAVSELIRILQGLELEKSVFRANHSSNPVPLEGRFPRERDALIALLLELLPRLDQHGPGRLPMSL
ncbi:MAG: radical SAM protein [Kiritimatiellae bacterium]|nr:radical SAM protein [Kiritimatiellia bacterium]